MDVLLTMMKDLLKEVKMKQCKQCVFEKDIVGRAEYYNDIITIGVDDCEHKWHNNYIDDMCCKCGIDVEYLDK
jgi:hypothetical protein